MNEALGEAAGVVLAELIKEPIEKTFVALKNISSVSYATYFSDFSKYSTYMYEKSSRVRTLYSKTRPLLLDDVYVSTRFTCGVERLTDYDVLRDLQSGERIVIKGNGGSGKTFFLKWLWLQCFKDPRGKIPIFVELRRLNDVQALDLVTFCRAELQSQVVFDASVFVKLCEAGRFNFIFDGFDEVTKDRRKDIERQILEVAEKYRGCGILVSGREDDRFSSWGPFSILSVAPLSLPEVRALIGKIPFDVKVKKRFIKGLTESFYSSHRSFLSNPLLAIMMLMTFSDNAQIPDKLSTFYKHAFQTLLTWHDALKDSFERQRCLSIDDFRSVFSTFCLISFYDQAYEFDEVLLRQYVVKALKYHGVSADIDSVLADMTESVNLLQKDGLKYVFVHRSFQEYFAAECAMITVSGRAKEFLEVFARRSRDSVFSLCYEIHPELVQDQFFLPHFRNLQEKGFFKGMRDKAAFSDSLGFALVLVVAFDADSKPAYITVIEPRSKKMEDLDFLSVINQVSGHSLGFDVPAHFFARTVFHRIHTKFGLSDPRKRRMGESHAVGRFVVNLSGNSVTVVASNEGEVKLERTELASIKRRIVEAIELDIELIQDSIVQFCRKAEKFLNAMEQSRKVKEASINDLLGL